MRKTQVLPNMIAITLLLMSSTLGAETGTAIEWHVNLKEAMRLAQRESRPLLLEFWTTWCLPCRTMESEFWPDSKVAALARKFVCVKIDADRAPGLVARYRVDGFPTLLFLDPWGEVMSRLDGFVRDEIITLLDGLPGDFSSISAAQARASGGRESLQPLLEIGKFYDDHGLYQVSTGFYEKALKTKDAKRSPIVKADLLTAIGWNHLRMEEPRKAKKAFEKCIKSGELYPRLDMTLCGLFSACLELGDRQKANAAFERLQADYPESGLVERARLAFASSRK